MTFLRSLLAHFAGPNPRVAALLGIIQRDHDRNLALESRVRELEGALENAREDMRRGLRKLSDTLNRCTKERDAAQQQLADERGRRERAETLAHVAVRCSNGEATTHDLVVAIRAYHDAQPASEATKAPTG